MYKVNFSKKSGSESPDQQLCNSGNCGQAPRWRMWESRAAAELGLEAARINRGTTWLKVLAVTIALAGSLLTLSACSSEFNINVNPTTITIRSEIPQNSEIPEIATPTERGKRN